MTQSQALSILKTGANVFLTGEPGSGKTYTINEYVAYLQARGIDTAITASTGIAATHISGMTIHSWSGVGIKTKLDKNDLDKIASSRHIAKRVRRAKVLIIDEVSMLAPGTLSMIDTICRELRQSSEPFGAIQIILVGDFFQLPPIVKPAVNDDPQISFAAEPAARFAYDSPAWQRSNPIVCYITEQHRQDDGDFLNLLSAVRRNAVGAEHLRRIETRKIDPHGAPKDAPKLFSHNIDVDRVNEEILARLPGAPRAFAMSAQGPEPLVVALKKGCLSPQTLGLKVGAAVMFTKNNPQEGFVNGTLGKVEEFAQHDGYPVVRTRSGRRIAVEPMDWAMEENGLIRARITQLPLRLAWAITVHKSQGMSLDEAVVDLRDVFEFGQGYVALSRVRRLSGLHLLGWNKRAFEVNPEVAAKDAKFRAGSEQAAQAFGDLSRDETRAKQEQFVRACGGIIISEVGPTAPKVSFAPTAANGHGNARQERRWQRTLSLIRSRNTIPAVAQMCGRTEATILQHLESLRALGKLSVPDIAHLARGSEPAIANIHAAFRELGSEKLSPVFDKLGGAYSYDQLRLARIMLDRPLARKNPQPSGFDKVREAHPNAYVSWDESQDEKLRQLFVKGTSVVDLARTFSRTSGAIRSRLAKLGLADK
ncbi:MAG: AAA family ATPase [Candidatus Binatia bacterium]